MVPASPTKVKLRIKNLLSMSDKNVLVEGSPREVKAYFDHNYQMGHHDWLIEIYDERRAKIGGFPEYGWRDLNHTEWAKWNALNGESNA